MSSNSNSKAAFGGGVIVVTIVFVIMKLVGNNPIAQLDWLWVLSPLWISVAWGIAWTIIGAVIVALVGGGVGIAHLASRPRGRGRVGARGGYRGLPNNEKAHGNYNYGAGRRS